MNKEISKILGELVNLKFDCSNKDNVAIINYLKEKFSDADDIVTVNNSNGFENLIIGVNTKLKNVENALILSGHIDTICPNESWDKTLRVDDKNMYGLGACDMKAYSAELIYQFKYLKKQNYPIIITLTADEETTVEGVQKVLEFFKNNNIQGKFFIIGEPTNSKVCSSHKGMVDIVANFTGKECHSSVPSIGINAIYIASKFAQKIEKLNKKYEPLKTSLNVSKISGGVSGNSVAQNCSLYMDFRPLNLNHHDTILKTIKQIQNNLAKEYPGCQIDLQISYDLPCFQEKTDLFIDKICQILKVEQKPFTAWTEAGYLSSVIPSGIIFGAGGIEFAHKGNEQISFEQLEVYDQKFIQLLEIYNQNN